MAGIASSSAVTVGRAGRFGDRHLFRLRLSSNNGGLTIASHGRPRTSITAMFSSKVNPVTGRVEWEAPEVIESELQDDSDVSKELFR